MSAVAYKTSILTSYYKMDNVLYEIRDAKGISKNVVYEAWKEEVLRDLLQAGFINIESDFYTISEEGREVIQQDSLLYYNKSLKTDKKFDLDTYKKATGFFANIWMLSIIGSISGTVLIYVLLKNGMTF